MRIEINEDNFELFTGCGFKDSWIMKDEDCGWHTFSQIGIGFDEYNSNPLYITDVRCVDELKIVNDEFMVFIAKVNESAKRKELKTNLIKKLSYRVRMSRFKIGDFMSLSKTLNKFTRNYRVWSVQDYVNKW